MAEHHHHPTTTHLQHHHPPSKLLPILTLFPIGSLLFLLSNIILTGTIIGLTIATPLFLIFSPILVPGLLVIAFAVTGFVTSAVFGVSGVSSMVYIVKYFRRRSGDRSVEDQVDYVKRGREMDGGYMG